MREMHGNGGEVCLKKAELLRKNGLTKFNRFDFYAGIRKLPCFIEVESVHGLSASPRAKYSQSPNLF